MQDLQIIYEDEWLVAVDKPANLLVHPSWITPAHEPTLMGLLKDQLNAQKLHTIHRLDRATSGVILVGKELLVSQALQEQFVRRSISKTYLCVTRGWPQESGHIDHPLVPKRDKFADPFAQENPEPKEATTDFKRLATVELDFTVGRYPKSRYSLVEARPKTGRKHQIRRHMKHILHPIVGDTKYGEGRHNRFFREQYNIHRMLLMATSLSFDHPKTNQRIDLHLPVSQEVNLLFKRLGWSGYYPAPID